MTHQKSVHLRHITLTLAQWWRGVA